MRTTVTLDDELFHQLKEASAKEKLTLSQWLSRAARAALQSRRNVQHHPPFRVITAGHNQPLIEREPRDFYETLEQDDLSSR